MPTKPKTLTLINGLFCALIILSLSVLLNKGYLSLSSPGGDSDYSWLTYDIFDELDDRMNAVNSQNCYSKSASDLRLPVNSVSQIPAFNRLLNHIWYPNRTLLLNLHNMALSRGFFYSYIFQRLNRTEQFMMQPGLMYYYFDSIASVTSSNKLINGSGIFFDKNSSYATWFRNLKFNSTLDLFGERAFRYDDYDEPTNWIREPTNKTCLSEDYAAGPNSNYTDSSYKINQWYSLYLPDTWLDRGSASNKQFQYSIGIKYSNQTGKFANDIFDSFTLFGPPSPGIKSDDKQLPVLYTEPYFDCGKSNRWIVTAVAPIIDQIPRYLDWYHLRRMQYVAVATMDMEFLSIDFNPCPFSVGYQPPSLLANTARCKPSTICEPLSGWGFRRGGYHCMCRPGYRFPPWQYGPFMGIEIESATRLEYKYGFDCVPVQLRQVIPVIRSNETSGTPQFIPGIMKRSVSNDQDGNDVTVEESKTNDISANEEEEAPEYYKPEYVRPERARITDRALQRVPKRIRESRILNKKLRLLRLMNLRQIEIRKNKEKKVKFVPRISYPYHLQPITNKKIEFVPRYSTETKKLKRKKRQAFDEKQYTRMLDIMDFMTSVNDKNCADFHKEDLYLPGDVGYNVEVAFSNQAKMALRLSHFLSNFLQNIDKYDEYGSLRGDRLFNVEQIFGEVLANVMGDLKIRGSGVFFDIDKFEENDGMSKQLFGPYAYRHDMPTVTDNTQPTDVANSNFRAIDQAGLPHQYIDEPWFKNVKERWQSNTYGLLKFREKIMIRSDYNVTTLVRFILFPMYFNAPAEKDGLWSSPYFQCNGYVNDWIITYSIPFFGLNSVKTAIEFKGVVTVDVALNMLDINQCPQSYYEPNAFKDTARCDYLTTFCNFLPGRKFVKGAYKCTCKVGYEYPFNDNQWYFDGQTMEEEYRKKMAGDKQSRYNNLKCRIALASTNKICFFVFLFLLTISLYRHLF